jgi:hypothetical protein
VRVALGATGVSDLDGALRVADTARTVGAAVDALNAPADAFGKQIAEVRRQFDGLIESAKSVGLWGEALALNHEKVMAEQKLFEQRWDQVLADSIGRDQRIWSSQPGGLSEGAALSLFDRAAELKLKENAARLNDMGLGATPDIFHFYSHQEKIALDAERAALQRQYAEQAAARTQARSELEASIRARGLRASGQTGAADMLEFDVRAAGELANLAKSLADLGVAAAESAALVDELRLVQARERQELALNRQAGLSILDWLQNQRTTPAGGFSVAEQLANSRAAFDRTLGEARLGNGDALGRITGDADALLAAARGMYASGGGFSALRSYVLDSLGGLDAVTAARVPVNDMAASLDASTQMAALVEENQQMRASLANLEVLMADLVRTNDRMAYASPPTPVGARA